MTPPDVPRGTSPPLRLGPFVPEIVLPPGPTHDRRELEQLIALDDARAAREMGKRAVDAADFTVVWLPSASPVFGGEWYRALRPAALASRAFGWHTAVAGRMGTLDDQPSGKLVFLTEQGSLVVPDLIILRPIRAWRLHWTEQAHANGQLVIADLDDDLWAHEAFGEERPDDDYYEEWCWDVDAWLVSTRALATRLRHLGPRKRRGWSAPVYVAPNCYDPYGTRSQDAGWPHPGRRIGTRLWLSGRMTPDLAAYQELYLPLLADLDLTWVHVGADAEPTHADLGHGMTSFRELGWPADRLVELPSCPIPSFGRVLGHELSIGAIAMSDHPYNKVKTETHAAELAGVGLPLVAASNHPLYRHIPGRVDLDPAAVRARVESLLDPETWHREAARATAWVRGIAARREATYLAALLQARNALVSRR